SSLQAIDQALHVLPGQGLEQAARERRELAKHLPRALPAHAGAFRYWFELEPRANLDVSAGHAALSGIARAPRTLRLFQLHLYRSRSADVRDAHFEADGEM